MRFLEVLSEIFGWVYTICWSCSFYTQPLLSYRRRSTSGTTIDFHFLNTFGFLGYLISNASFLWSPVIRSQYALRNHDLPPTVTLNDVVFAAHGLIMCIVVSSQYVLPNVWGFDRSPGTRPSRIILGVATGSILAVLATILVVLCADPASDPRKSWAWIDVFYTLSYVKLVVTVVKYAPQLRYNYENKATVGWSISMILLDFSGSILSMAQQAIDSWLLGDWSGITGNPAKFALGNISLIYDVLFMIQHFVLYKDNDGAQPKDGEQDALLERGDANGRRLG